MTQDIHSRLKALKPTKATGILKQYLPLILEKIEQGVTQKEIFKAIKEAGLDINENSFRTFIKRYRNKINKAKNINFDLPDSDTTKQDNHEGTSSQAESNKKPTRMTVKESLDPKFRDELGEKYLNRRHKPKWENQ